MYGHGSKTPYSGKPQLGPGRQTTKGYTYSLVIVCTNDLVLKSVLWNEDLVSYYQIPYIPLADDPLLRKQLANQKIRINLLAWEICNSYEDDFYLMYVVFINIFYV